MALALATLPLRLQIVRAVRTQHCSGASPVRHFSPTVDTHTPLLEQTEPVGHGLAAEHGWMGGDGGVCTQVPLTQVALGAHAPLQHGCPTAPHG